MGGASTLQEKAIICHVFVRLVGNRTVDSGLPVMSERIEFQSQQTSYLLYDFVHTHTHTFIAQFTHLHIGGYVHYLVLVC